MNETQEKKKLVIEFSGKLPSLNDYQNACRRHWSKGAKMKKEVEEDIVTQLLPYRFERFNNPVTLSYVWHEKRRNRDKDNVQSAQKFIQDALVSVGILYNDGWKQIDHIYHDVIIGSEYKVVLEITEI